jgi:hypothetical protein
MVDCASKPINGHRYTYTLTHTHTHTSLDVLTLALEKTSLHNNLENLSLYQILEKNKHVSKLALLETFSPLKP